jgi:hypothetical protein
VRAIPPGSVEGFRPLLPVGYEAGVRAYRAAVAELTPRDLADHYTSGLGFFHDQFAPHLRRTLEALAGGAWRLDDYVAYAAGTDVDFMTHLVEAVAAGGGVSLFPGDWFGFLVGCTRDDKIVWDAGGGGELACLCVPSVRNGRLTEEMLAFLGSAPDRLLNLNLFPTLTPDERHVVAEQLAGLLPRSVLSISFSRGFGLTASQLGVALVHRDHPYRERFARQWAWLTNFFNAIAARAFMRLDLKEVEEVDVRRRAWVDHWLEGRGLPVTEGGTYYVKSFRPLGTPPDYLRPLERAGVIRCCFKPPLY